MTGDRRVTAIVLAGGRSSRFGRDKLAELIDGRTLLAHAIESVANVAHDLIVVTAPGAGASDALPDVEGLRITHDATPFEGPLAGALAGLEAAVHPIALVVAGDMPSMSRDVLELLLDGLSTSGGRAAVLLRHGHPQPFPVALRRAAALAAARQLMAEGVRRFSALGDRLEAVGIAEAVWGAIDPAAKSLRDVDRPEDLR